MLATKNEQNQFEIKLNNQDEMIYQIKSMGKTNQAKGA